MPAARRITVRNSDDITTNQGAYEYLLRRSLQPPDEAFRTEMPDPIPYFIVALDGYERKDDLHALAMEIGNAWNKEDDITLVTI